MVGCVCGRVGVWVSGWVCVCVCVCLSPSPPLNQYIPFFLTEDTQTPFECICACLCVCVGVCACLCVCVCVCFLLYIYIVCVRRPRVRSIARSSITNFVLLLGRHNTPHNTIWTTYQHLDIHNSCTYPHHLHQTCVSEYLHTKCHINTKSSNVL